jgi:hypothetical protein
MYNAARSTANQTCFFDDDETSDDDLYQSDESSDDPQSGDNFSGSASDEDFGFGSTPKMSSLVHALNISYEDMNDYEDEDDFHAQDLPHWFSNEAPGSSTKNIAYSSILGLFELTLLVDHVDQVRLIISKYSRILHIDRLRESSVRAPKPFIGRIRRTPVKTADNTFKTLDQIDIFINDFVPMGQELPLKSSESGSRSFASAEHFCSQLTLVHSTHYLGC